MDLRVFFRHMDSSPALAAHAQTKICERLAKYGLNAADAQVTFAVEHGVNEARCHVSSHVWGTLDAHAEDDDNMYAAVDRLADTLDARLRRLKEQVVSHRAPRNADRAAAAAEADAALAPEDAEEAHA